MPEYLAPGVYIEEISTGPRPIEGVSTSTAGFVGETERGSTKPTLVTSWTDYQRTFGGYIDRPPLNRINAYLPYAVRGFFDNGGQRVYVARVVGPAAVAATGDLGNCVVEANGEGVWGNNLIVAVKPASVAQPGTRDSRLVPDCRSRTTATACRRRRLRRSNGREQARRPQARSIRRSSRTSTT